MGFSVDQKTSIGRLDPPIYGAIFMANRSTKKESLSRMLFGLPPPQVGFVKKVKCGMVLFLFEFEERKLYGVFQAFSDGAVNIEPHAFRSSGKQFPAQIRFKPLWNCKPLSEHEFRDAIRDNYYTANKFDLGLSKHQVSKLLRLFDSSRIKNQKLNSQLSKAKHISRPASPDYCREGLYEDDECIAREMRRGRFSVENESVNLVTYPVSSLAKINISGVSDKHIIERKSPTFGDHVLSSLEHVNSPCRSPYSKSLADGLFPSSKRKLVSFNVEEEDHMSPPMKHIRSGSLDVISDFGDFIPLNTVQPTKSSTTTRQPLSSEYSPFTRQVSLVRESLSPSLSPSKHPPYVPDHPSLRQVSLVRENLSPSLSPSKYPPYVPDHYCPAKKSPEGSPYLDLQPSATTVPQEPSEDRNENAVHTGLRSDVEGKRVSVFDRLKGRKNETVPNNTRLEVSKKETVPNNDDLIDEDEISVNELMNVLRKYRKYWTDATDKPQQKEKVKDVDNDNAGITHIEPENASEELPHNEHEGASDEQQCVDAVFEEMPVNFNRRNTIRKMKSKLTEVNDGSSKMLLKRRKLIRPSFGNGATYDKEVISESLVSNGEHQSSQKSGVEIGVSPISEVMSESLVSGTEYQSSKNSGVEIGVIPIIHHNNDKTEICKDEGGGGGGSGKNNENEVVQICLEHNGCSFGTLSGSQDFKGKIEGFIQELIGNVK